MKVTIYFNQTKSNFIKSLKNGTYPNIPRKVEILDEMIYTDLAFQLDLNRDEQRHQEHFLLATTSARMAVLRSCALDL